MTVQGPYILDDGRVLGAYVTDESDTTLIESRIELRKRTASLPEPQFTWYLWDKGDIAEIAHKHAEELRQEFEYDETKWSEWPEGFNPDSFTQYIYDQNNTQQPTNPEQPARP